MLPAHPCRRLARAGHTNVCPGAATVFGRVLRPARGGHRERGLVDARYSSNAEPYSKETRRLVKNLATRQAIKTLLHYLQETNGRLHFFLHDYIAHHPLKVAGDQDADDWLLELASAPVTPVSNPHRSVIVSAASRDAATSTGIVNPRDACERILVLREHIAKQMGTDLTTVPDDNAKVLRASAMTVLQRTFEMDAQLPRS